MIEKQRYFPLQWADRSPELILEDFFLFGVVKGASLLY